MASPCSANMRARNICRRVAAVSTSSRSKSVVVPTSSVSNATIHSTASKADPRVCDVERGVFIG